MTLAELIEERQRAFEGFVRANRELKEAAERLDSTEVRIRNLTIPADVEVVCAAGPAYVVTSHGIPVRARWRTIGSLAEEATSVDPAEIDALSAAASASIALDTVLSDPDNDVA